MACEAAHVYVLDLPSRKACGVGDGTSGACPPRICWSLRAVRGAAARQNPYTLMQLQSAPIRSFTQFNQEASGHCQAAPRSFTQFQSASCSSAQ
eukprot:15459452-Alexandrium_andersonii.AAC.1